MGSCSLEAVFLGMRKEVFTTLCFPKLTCVWAALGGACVHNPRQQLTAPHPVTIMHTFTFLFTYFRSERVSVSKYLLNHGSPLARRPKLLPPSKHKSSALSLLKPGNYWTQVDGLHHWVPVATTVPTNGRKTHPFILPLVPQPLSCCHGLCQPRLMSEKPRAGTPSPRFPGLPWDRWITWNCALPHKLTIQSRVWFKWAVQVYNMINIGWQKKIFKAIK